MISSSNYLINNKKITRKIESPLSSEAQKNSKELVKGGIGNKRSENLVGKYGGRKKGTTWMRLGNVHNLLAGAGGGKMIKDNFWCLPFEELFVSPPPHCILCNKSFYV